MRVQEGIAKGMITDAVLYIARSNDSLTITAMTPDIVLTPGDMLWFKTIWCEVEVTNYEVESFVPVFEESDFV